MRISALVVVAAAVVVSGCHRDVATEPSVALKNAVTGMVGSSVSPLFIIDGAPAPLITRGEVGKLDISAVEVVRGPAAVQLYGTRAKDGAISITTVAGAQRNALQSRAVVSQREPGSGVRSALARDSTAGPPLYVIDGVPMVTMTSTSFLTLNIESVEVVKGAAAVALYGERARNGVIAIKTKGAKKK